MRSKHESPWFKIMELPIKLGRKMPNGPMSPDMVAVSSGDEEHYPMLYLEWDKPYNLPDGEFTMTVRAKRVRSTKDDKHNKVNEDVEIREITSIEGGKKKKKTARDEAEDTLDKLRESHNNSEDEEEY